MTPRILYIDHEDMGRLTLGDFLRDGGFEVVLAATVDEALERLRADAPDVVVVDPHLPGQDAWAMLEALSGTCGSLPMVILTWELGRLEGLMPVRPGRDSGWIFLAKPVWDMGIVRHAVQSLLGLPEVSASRRGWRKTSRRIVQYRPTQQGERE
jgi:CheY-like chemotaxis protein